METAVLRARLLGAVAAGFALHGCHGERTNAPSEPADARASVVEAIASTSVGSVHTVASTVESVVPPDPPTSATTIATATATATKPVPSPPPPPMPTACAADTKREKYCLDAFTSPPKQIAAPPSYDKNGCVSAGSVHDVCNGIHEVLAGPIVAGNKCCFTVCRGQMAPCGRPLDVGEGEWRTATVVQRDDWTAYDCVASDDVASDRASDHDASISSALRDAWSCDATAEHASIAAFARFTLELLAVGAPATFVEAAQRAALDEIEHAKLCFSLARRYAGGRDIGPAALPLDGLTLRNDLADVAAATVEEACCAETFAALVAVRALERCRDPEAYHALERIASDEMRHAELAWRFVAWALRVGDTRVRDAVVRAFERGLGRLNDAAVQGSSDSRGDEAWRAAGRSTPRDLADVAREARESLIRPCMERLLAT